LATSKVKKKPTKKKGYSEWTDARRRSFITSVLRQGSRKWPPIYEALALAKTEKKTNSFTGRLAQHYMCAHCTRDFSSTMVQVDHIDPVICPFKGFESWDVYIQRLYCETSNLQVLCKPCHEIKSTKERNSK
jgi:5-methylcytosine-specific restriction endonuclease McrA